ncbi:MAG: hypothetical protein J5I98_02315 [Phaeodactylibacter sp.]|nr:hypothetical protein [Phaeodactylibacter sp.]
MKKTFLALLLWLACLFALSAQRNYLYFFYGPAITKTNFDEELANSPHSYHFKKKKPSRPLPGFVVGLAYERQIGEKWGLAIGLRHALRGQQSPHHFHSSQGRQLDYPPTYGGTSYHLKYLSTEFFLAGKRQLWKKGKWVLMAQSGVSLDIFYDLSLRNFTIPSNTGIKRPGCCGFGKFSYDYSHYFDNTWLHLTNGHWRIGVLFGGQLSYHFTPWLYGGITSELEFLSRVHNDDWFIFIGAENIKALGCQFSLGLNF